ncbi:branched-chain amino acid ABC transporter permease [Streptomyces sp. NPDC006175]|uniref:branched-chain amino acid ABC transporter permease n=1 Tax=Streptomyces sp. NPDC006175 TaxID=3154471 RepID=UPI0033B335CC
MNRVKRTDLVVLVLVAVVGLAFPLVFPSNYVISQGIEILFFVGVCTAWNIVGGMAGQFAFTHSIYIGCGAYAAAVCSVNGISPFLGMAIGCALSVVLGLAIAWTAARFQLPRLAFALITLAFSEIGLLCVLASDRLGGPAGFPIPFTRGESFWMLQLSYTGYYMLVLLFTLLCLGVALTLMVTRSGYTYRCVRDNERAASAIGISTLRVKLHSMMISAALTSLIGSAYALYLGFIDPQELAGPEIMIEVILFAAVGGMGTLWGPALGAAVLVLLGNVLREEFGGVLPPGSHTFVYGSAVVLVIVLAREGLLDVLRKAWRTVRGRATARTASQGAA